MSWPPANATILVTGASTGIGNACALALADLGVHVFAGVRSEADRQFLSNANADHVTPILLDVTDTASVAAAATKVTAALKGSHFIGLVNNAGIMISGPLEFVSQQDLQTQMDVNVVGQMAVTRAFLPLLREHQGRIVNIGSTSGHIPSAFTGPYCASKYALLALTDVLRMELRPFGIHVAMIEPGVIATPIWSKVIKAEGELQSNMAAESETLYGHALADRRLLLNRLDASGGSPETVATAVQHALLSQRPNTRYVLGLGTRIKLMVAKFLPNSIRDALKYVHTKLRRAE
ncbi:MAG: SDR family oxidoreductase [Pseudomonadales bacterium]